jgi:hypothetical protein
VDAGALWVTCAVPGYGYKRAPLDMAATVSWEQRLPSKELVISDVCRASEATMRHHGERLRVECAPTRVEPALIEAIHTRRDANTMPLCVYTRTFLKPSKALREEAHLSLMLERCVVKMRQQTPASLRHMRAIAEAGGCL